MSAAWQVRGTMLAGLWLVAALGALPGCRRPPDSCCGQPAGVACAGPMDPGGGVRSAIRTEPPRSGAVGANACVSPAVIPTGVGGGPRAPRAGGSAGAGNAGRVTGPRDEVVAPRFGGAPRGMQY